MHIILGWAIQLILQLLIKQSNNFLTQCTHIEHMLEGILIKHIFDKMTAVRTKTFFQLVLNIYGYACTMIVHIQADQLLTQLLIDK